MHNYLPYVTLAPYQILYLELHVSSEKPVQDIFSISYQDISGQ